MWYNAVEHRRKTVGIRGKASARFYVVPRRYGPMYDEESNQFA